MRYETLLKSAKWAWIVAVVAVSGYFLISRWEQVEFYFHDMPARNLFYATIFLVFGKLTLVFISKYSIESEGKHISYAVTFCIVTFTQLAKYLPGGFWHFVGRFSAYNGQSITLKRSTRALITENVWLLSGAFLTGTLTGVLSLDGQQILESAGVQIQGPVLGLTTIFLWAVLLVCYEKLFRAERTISYIKIFGAQSISWLCLGISFAFLLPDLNFTSILFNISVYSFGWLVGYVMIFAPGGIGVREIIIVWMLSGVMDSENAIIYSTIHRFLFIAVELLLGAVASSIYISKKHLELE